MDTPRLPLLTVAIVILAPLTFLSAAEGDRLPGLLWIGVALGVTLYHAAFGFTSAYRRAFVDKDLSGLAAQAVMLILAMLLFAPVLAQGQAFGQGVGGAIAPVGLSMAFGAFLFGMGMQLGDGCASGTLYTAGGGSARAALVLLFFCGGAFWGSLDLAWWESLAGTGIGSVSLGQALGWEAALPLQIGALGLILLLFRAAGGRLRRALWWDGDFSMDRLIRGPWPLLQGAILLALLNWLTLVVAGHAWSITWAFSLWAAKGALLMGWMPEAGSFWSGPFQQAALARPVWADSTSLMNIGLLGGALIAAALAGKTLTPLPRDRRNLAAAVMGGLAMGYGARLAYGCNIGAFFSGIASGSLHGWVWLLCALPGNFIGVRLRPLFNLSNQSTEIRP
ncbi:YeeE/YedE family protein [Magnetospira sp. QH-2]|uniref:YeeE/YedE family protein n=1 Tax=Magnetospira sp. (strain QH-2) TaxID=1288970 RepID=UPI0003E813D6|nr:YeeE/YedE family protein [Magnetospira sp. QH-2]CCQ73175.1 Conserved membrane protein of unknown function [Magnetospira sp. QH-2]